MGISMLVLNAQKEVVLLHLLPLLTYPNLRWRDAHV